ncbi:hypothetical protein [Petropleomorpha daqingensis]|uniref:Uncharacterized protein n=1 Tax=Petropleomorpha daqingensis TaxID=2026353 RepID=A0A853CNK7_9ACTN|nr:hypothetical protein [Petropleomorpha daqingensis]NYJ08771.1 hypothetical protein [Petropleomorpha daqingensis]
MFTVIGPVLWSACFLVALVSAVLAGRSRRAMVVGRVAVGVLMLVGGAVFNLVQLLLGNDYSGFADPSPFGWVTDAWEAVVPAHHVVLIGLLVLFEATVGVLVLSGGRRTQFGYAAAIAFHALLWLFGWFEAVYVVLVLPALVLLLRAERRAGRRAAAAVPDRPEVVPADGGLPRPRAG